MTSPKTKAQTGSDNDKPFKCPDCPRTFALPTGLGIHRRTAHGVLGSAPSTLAARKKSAEKKAALKKLPKPIAALSIAAAANISKKPSKSALTSKGKVRQSGDFECPECHEKFKYARVLGKHRAMKHNVPGSSNSALLKQRNKTERHTANGHSTSLETLPPSHPESSNSPASLDPLAYALCIGSVKEFCRHFAEEHGIVTKQFTRQFAELFLREARR